MSVSLQPVVNFLDDLKKNNNREWFNEHKTNYKVAHGIMIAFAEELLDEMRRHDHIETNSGKRSLFRIYRDVRFSKDKSPYKTSWSGSFRRASKALRGGYYYHVEPGNTFIAGGFFGPNAEDLRHIRNHLAQDESALREVLKAPVINSYFGSLQGEQLKSTPTGFAKDHPAIDLLRYKHFILKHHFSDTEMKSLNFHQKVAEGFQHLRPFFDVMSEILTTDLNGISLI